MPLELSTDKLFMRKEIRHLIIGCTLIALTFPLSACEARDSSKSAATQAAPMPNSSEWSPDVLNHYNPYGLVNDTGCPKIPGIFFTKSGSRCTCYLPGMGSHTTILGNPSYRYSVPVSDEASFVPDLSLKDRCETNPKVQYLRSSLGTRYTFKINPGKAAVELPNAAEVVPDRTVCKITITPNSI